MEKMILLPPRGHKLRREGAKALVEALRKMDEREVQMMRNLRDSYFGVPLEKQANSFAPTESEDT